MFLGGEQMPLRQEEYFWEEEVVAQQTTKTKAKPKQKTI
jgi:hypothetical protein